MCENFLSVRGLLLIDQTDENEESSDEDEVINNKNYRQRIQGPWIFGLYCKHDSILERLF